MISLRAALARAPATGATLALTAGAAFLSAGPAQASRPGFTLGVAAGAVGDGSVRLWTRHDGGGRVSVRVATDRRFRNVIAERSATAKSPNDNTVTMRVRGLEPQSSYFYRFSAGRRKSEIGTFRTPPRPTSTRTIRFAFSGDAVGLPGAGRKARLQQLPGLRAHGQRAQRLQRQPRRHDLLGPRGRRARRFARAHASPAEVGQVPPEPRACGRCSGCAAPPGSTPLGRPRVHQRLHPAPRTARRSTTPGRRPSSTTPRRATARATASTGVPLGQEPRDLLPRRALVPQRQGVGAAACATTRRRASPTSRRPRRSAPATRSARRPRALATRRRPRCLEAINDPGRTMLGSTPVQALHAGVKASKATFKVVMNEVPIQQFYALPYDRWEGYEAERQELLHFLQDNVQERGLPHHRRPRQPRQRRSACDARRRRAALETPSRTFIDRPVATISFAKEIDGAAGHPGPGDLITRGLLRRHPAERGGDELRELATCSATGRSL